MRSSSLHPLLLDILATTLAAGAAGCSGSSTPPETAQQTPTPTPEPTATTTVTVPSAEPADAGANETETEPPPPPRDAGPPASEIPGQVCKNPSDMRNFLVGVRPPGGADALELRRFFRGGKGNAVLSAGDPCATAGYESKCEADFAALTAASGFRVECRPGACEHYLAYTRGDEVKALTSRDDVVAFLGDIDTPTEAQLVAWVDGYGMPSCGTKQGNPVKQGKAWVLSATKMVSDCPIQVDNFRLSVGADAKIKVLSQKKGRGGGGCVGRFPEGLHAPAPQAPNEVGRYFAECAELEHASVTAFARLRGELQGLGAPEELIEGSKRAEADEVRHWQRVAELARGFGATPMPSTVDDPQATRTVEAIALENEIEGCVRETFGALLGLWQAERATDARVRETLQELAADEIRHAELSWSISRWLRERLSREACAELDAQRRAAVAALKQELESEPHADLVTTAGLPSAAEALALAERLEQQLWAQA